MPLIIVAVALAAAAGVALVMYGIVSRNQFVAATNIDRNARVTYRTLADVREHDLARLLLLECRQDATRPRGVDRAGRCDG